MEAKFYVIVSDSEDQYGKHVCVHDLAYANKKEAKSELACTYHDFLKECDRGNVSEFFEYSVDIKSMKDFNEWRVTSATVPDFYQRMWIEEITVTINTDEITNEKTAG